MNILDIFNWALDHKAELVAVSASVHVAVTHIYLFVTHQGGLRTLWGNFIGPTNPVSQSTIDLKAKLARDEVTYRSRLAIETDDLHDRLAKAFDNRKTLSAELQAAEQKDSAPVATVSQPVADSQTK